jgi:hypothetical protein
VADAVFEEVVCRLLAGRGKTALLVTSHYKYLRSEVADRLLKEKQSILYIESGKIINS